MVLHHLSGTVAIPRLLLKILHFVKYVVPVNLRLPGGTTGAPALRSARGTLGPGQRVKEGHEMPSFTAFTKNLSAFSWLGFLLTLGIKEFVEKKQSSEFPKISDSIKADVVKRLNSQTLIDFQ